MALGASASVPITVVVPTIGRPSLLTACLASIVACRPRPESILVVDQSGGRMAGVVEPHAASGVELVVCDGVGIATGTNLGLRRARHEHVLVTHDDCTVRADWVGRAGAHAAEDPSAIFTGRVLPAGNAAVIPSLKTDAEPCSFTGAPSFGALYPANMLLPRELVLESGGFDERRTLRLAAEDNDLCFRWIDGGGTLRYEPDLVVWHHEWRSRPQIRRQYLVYGRGQGALYAKHLASGDTRMWRSLAGDCRRAARQVASGLVRQRREHVEEGAAMLVGMPVGFVAGLVESWKVAADGRGAGSGLTEEHMFD